MLEIFKSRVAITALCAVVFVYIAKFLAKGFRIRRQMHKLPGPPGHSYIFGHLMMMADLMKEVPTHAHPHVTSLAIAQKYKITSGYFYVDVWPFSDPMVYVIDPAMAQKVTVEHSLPKHPVLGNFLYHLTGPGDIVSTDGAHWKKWRSIMNPGFAASHLMTLAPGIVDDGLVFMSKLAQHADKKDVFRLEETATRLTVDVIGKVALDLQLNTQNGENKLVTAFRDQVQLVPNEGPMDPFSYYVPIKFYKRWRNSRIMNEEIGKVLDQRFAQSGASKEKSIGSGGKKPRQRAIVDLAMDSYLTQLNGGDADTLIEHKSPVMDAEFRRMATTQIRTFIFAGHDTTSSTICYALYMLQNHPEALARIRKELDEVLGSVVDTPQVIKNDPHILNKLEYTMCVVKETLRLWPAASSTRIGEPGYMLRDPKTGESYPTEGMLVWVPHWAIHRDPAVWGETAGSFDPSRFMSGNDSKLPEGAWRPFEKGPRNCIGQELALLEARIILALTVRTFEFDIAIDSLDELKDDGSCYSKDDKWRQGKQDLDGEPIYPILLGSAKPREGMPVKVRRV